MDTHKISFAAADGYRLGGYCWRHAATDSRRPVVLIAAATSVRCRYYFRFAAYLHANGFDVATFDYRGIGESRPARLRGFEASWLDWGRLDIEAALRHLEQAFPGQPIHFVAHSIGGFLLGLAPSSRRVARVFTMGAQYAHWRDYARHLRMRMFLKWHVLMPLMTALCGYFPGRLLGWLEDTPRGVVRDWIDPSPRFEDAFRAGAARLAPAERAALVERFAAMRADVLALSVSDDEFGTVAAIERALAYFRNCPRVHLRLTPAAFGHSAIGHFSYFHDRFQRDLWPIALEWLRHGRLAPAPATVVSRQEGVAAPYLCSS